EGLITKVDFKYFDRVQVQQEQRFEEEYNFKFFNGYEVNKTDVLKKNATPTLRRKIKSNTSLHLQEEAPSTCKTT
ncbi:hypothetical protein Taro_042886, partial [Colocasia esculenta]|nr:hypothetical protein [Colocasia esculenta]